MSTPQQLKLHSRLKSEYSRMATKLARRLEFLERKSARFRNHLHFTLHCKPHGVTPVSLNITILSADKGRSTVILNTTTYKEKANELLSDTNTYTQN